MPFQGRTQLTACNDNQFINDAAHHFPIKTRVNVPSRAVFNRLFL